MKNHYYCDIRHLVPLSPTYRQDTANLPRADRILPIYLVLTGYCQFTSCWQDTANLPRADRILPIYLVLAASGDLYHGCNYDVINNYI